jgi:hypothetical protein
MDAIKTIELNDGNTFRIFIDPDPTNPRTEYDNLGTMVCFHKRYDLGDEHEYVTDDFRNWDELRKAICAREDVALIFPVFLFDHSGLALSLNAERFAMQDSQRWDWGQIGFMFISKTKVRKEYDCKRISSKVLEKVTSCLTGEIETYNHYLAGRVYGFTLTSSDGTVDDNVWGFVGDIETSGMLDHISDQYRDAVKNAI